MFNKMFGDFMQFCQKNHKSSLSIER